MSIFDKMKDMVAMRQQAKEIQATLAKEIVTGRSNTNGCTVIMDGNQNVLSVSFNDSLVGDKVQLERHAKEAFTRAHDELKKLMVSKFSGMLSK
ncbi:MAG: YbaB/EbfC family nucleoid-associated protein [bacterium]|nr:YbaB/EbfC family nucleoid-associated protein [bacterium]